MDIHQIAIGVGALAMHTNSYVLGKHLASEPECEISWRLTNGQVMRVQLLAPIDFGP